MTSVTITQTKETPLLHLTLKLSDKFHLNNQVDQLLIRLKALRIADESKVEAWQKDFARVNSAKGEDVADGLCFLLFHIIHKALLQNNITAEQRSKLQQFEEEIQRMIGEALPAQSSVSTYIEGYRKDFIYDQARSIADTAVALGLYSRENSSKWLQDLNAHQNEREKTFKQLSLFMFMVIEPGFQKQRSVSQRGQLQQLSDDLRHILSETTTSGTAVTLENELAEAREKFLKESASTIIEAMKKDGLYATEEGWKTLFDAIDIKKEEGRATQLKRALLLLCYFRRHYIDKPIEELSECTRTDQTSNEKILKLSKYGDQISALMAATIQNHASVEEYFATIYTVHADSIDLEKKKCAHITALAQEKARAVCADANQTSDSMQQSLERCRRQGLQIVRRREDNVNAIRTKISATTRKVAETVEAVDVAGFKALAESKAHLDAQYQSMILLCRNVSLRDR